MFIGQALLPVRLNLARIARDSQEWLFYPDLAPAFTYSPV
jgi:hypothetical protein